LAAQKPYWQITDADFERAMMASESTPRKAKQDPKQSVHATGGIERQGETAAQQKSPVLQGFAGDCDLTRNHGSTP